MKLTILFLTVGFLQVSANGISQTVTLSGKNMPLEKVFSVIKEQTGYVVFFDYAVLEGSKPVSLSVKDASLESVLENVLQGQSLKYTIKKKTIIITKATAAVALSSDRQLKSNGTFDLLLKDTLIDVAGRVVDSTGSPLAGVSIRVRASKQGTSSNGDGYFSLKGINEDATLELSLVGYYSLTLKVSNTNTLSNIVLRLNPDELGSVIVSTGYQDIPKERATGSFAKIDNELLNRKVSTNVLDRIYEVTSGLNVNNRPSSNPQRSSNLTIRGISTINADFKPLIVIDGFPYNEGDANLINNINPNDVESITVLKDAAAASIWGARSGNGVIVITTKKGRFNSKANVQLNTNISIAEKLDLFYMPTISSTDFIDFEIKRFNEGGYDGILNNTSTYPIVSQVIEILEKKRAGLIPDTEADILINNFRNYNVRDDIDKYLLQSRINQQYSLSVTGGSEKHYYYGSVGYDQNRGDEIGSNYKRLTLRLDNTFRPIKKIEITAFISYAQGENQNNSLGYTSFLPTGSGYSPIAPYTPLTGAIPYSLRLAYTDTAVSPGLLDWHYRPLEEQRSRDNTTRQFDTRFGAGIKYLLITGLNTEIKFQYQKIFGANKAYFSEQSYFTRDIVNRFLYKDVSDRLVYPIPQNGILDITNTERTTYNFRGQINFNRRYGNHEIAALVGSEIGETNYDGIRIRKYGYDKELNIYSTTIDYNTNFLIRPGNSSTQKIPVGDVSTGFLNRLLSYYTNGAYTLNDRYTMTASARWDGTNLFGVKTNDKITPLWSTGIAWNISKENFYKLFWLPQLKFRATFGFAGNIKNDATSYPTIYYKGADPLTGAVYSSLLSPPNPALRWERTRIINLAIDFTTQSHLLNCTIEFYQKKGIDLIASTSVDPTTGVTEYTANNASIKGKGVDLNLNMDFSAKIFKWNTDLLLSYQTDKVISYEFKPTSDLLANTDNLHTFIGKPLFSVFSYRWAGLNPVNGTPMGYVADTVASYEVVLGTTGATYNTKSEDLKYNGPLNPVFFGSLRNTFSYANFSFSFNITYKFGHYFRRASINYQNLVNEWGGHRDYNLRWQKPGDESKTYVPSMPAIINGSQDLFYSNSEVLAEKADYIRLQDIRISYDLSENTITKLKLKKVQLYLYANNIGILWRANRFKIDPDAAGGFQIPVSRIFSAGIAANF